LINRKFLVYLLAITSRGNIISDTIQFPKIFVILGNLVLAIWSAMDIVAFLLINVSAGVIFFIIALIVVYGVLKFLICTRLCYNCKKALLAQTDYLHHTLENEAKKTIGKTYGIAKTIFF
jgi:hypothetical protein